MKILPNIKNPDDLKKVASTDLPRLSAEIRQFLLHSLSTTGGHLASNLGTVELTVALHRSFNSPTDKLIWDVGHQAYVHKMLTGRMDQFPTLRKLDGLSGFLKPNESEHDVFGAGHSSTSISAALGFAKANELSKKNDHVVAIIGDGALTGGMAFEAMNHAGHHKEKIIIVLNDNDMSIDDNVGGMSSYLTHIRTSSAYRKFKLNTESTLVHIPKWGSKLAESAKKIKNTIKYLLVPGMLFEDIGLKYFGPIDGHDVAALEDVFEMAKHSEESCVIHVITKKGKGYIPAEQAPDRYHGVNPFNLSEGIKPSNKKGLSHIFGDHLTEMAHEDKKIVAMTAAMCSGTGLCSFKNTHPDRFIDVGIAEQHAVTMAAGLAVEGYKPVFVVYSTFLQRSYDQMIHDVCIPNLPVIFAVDRAGIVGQDGETHHGIFDLSFTQHMPHMTVYSPKDADELKAVTTEVMNTISGPVMIRYPKADGVTLLPFEGDPLKPFIEKNLGDDFAIIPVGNLFKNANDAFERLTIAGFKGKLINPRCVKPMPMDALIDALGSVKHVFTIEDNVQSGGFGETFLVEKTLRKLAFEHYIFSMPNAFIDHGTIQELHDRYGLSGEKISARIEQILK